jgi:hypothetical protein
MKKVLLLAVVALFVMMPFASFAMTTISDSDLNAITAQEGVSIYLNNVTLSGINATMSWGQANLSFNTTNPIAGFAFDNGGFLGAAVSTTGNITVNGLLTIDVGVNNGSTSSLGNVATSSTTTGTGTNAVTTYGYTYLPGGINLGLTNMAIGVGGVQMIVKVGAEKSLSVPSLTMTMGTAFISNVTTTVNGNIIISTH